MKVIGFDHLGLNVNDVDRALEFYTGTLGLEALRLDEFRSGDAPFPSVRLSGSAIIDLVQSERNPDGNNVDHFCLVIEPTDMEQLEVEFEGKGIELGRRTGRRWGAQGWGRSFYIKDSEGNTIELKSHPPGFE